METSKWISNGKALGLTGKDLIEYVEGEKKEAQEREDRLYERNQRKLADEYERNQRKLADEAKELAIQKEKEMEFEREKAAQREKELAMQLEIASKTGTIVGSGAMSGTGTDKVGVKATRPKLPSFNEAKDDMDAFLERFERFAESQNWDRGTWAVSLGPLLVGKGLQVYTSMSPGEINNYDVLKVALLRRYGLTEEGFRRKYHEVMPEAGETLFQFTSRVCRYFERWTDLAGCEESFEGLRDFVCMEQVIAKCSPELAVHLRERKPKVIKEMVEIGERYLDAHGGTIRKNKASGNRNNTPVQINKGNAQAQDRRSFFSNRGRCYNCGSTSHRARECERGRYSRSRYGSPRHRSPRQYMAAMGGQGQRGYRPSRGYRVDIGPRIRIKVEIEKVKRG